jgi:hypothetical protein
MVAPTLDSTGSSFNFGPGCNIDTIPNAVMGFSGSTNLLEVLPKKYLLLVTFVLNMAAA